MRYAIVGTGFRSFVGFAKSLTTEFRDEGTLVGLYDINRKRAEYFNTLLGYKVEIFDSFEEMIDKAKPDCVMVTSIDRTHHDYIIRAMEKGCDVICEKPMTIDAEKCRAIFEAEKKYGKEIRVTFNCRYMPYFSKLKEILLSGVIGKVLSVNYEHCVGVEHGADYFRRWHRKMENSGGMLLHKSTHHFDIVNWLLEDEPETVAAHGGLNYFGANGPYCGHRCGECGHAGECRFFYDIEKADFENNAYNLVKDEDGYIRDQCVFGRDIDIYDNMSVSVKYKGGTLLTYNLSLFNPCEGYRISFVGTKGRIEAFDQIAGVEIPSVYKIKVITESAVTEHTFPIRSGLHSGADDIMRKELFRRTEADKTLKRKATVYDGAVSLLIGVCANESIKEGRTVNVQKYLDKCKAE